MRTGERCGAGGRLPRSTRLVLLGAVLIFSRVISAAQQAAPWPEADKLFHQDPRWLGADAAFSVDLGGGRVLWLFNDTFVAQRPGNTRRQAAFVRNTVAIETGYDPSHASIRFYWRTRQGGPSEIFPSDRQLWMWPWAGIRVGNKLLLFCTRVVPEHKKRSLGFRLAGWNAYIVARPDEEPSAWTLEKVAEDHGNVIMASAVLHKDGFVYLFGTSEPEHDLYLARCATNQIERGRFDGLEWWSGSGWQRSESEHKPVLRAVATEASVQCDPRGGYLEINSQGFGATDIVMRSAPRLDGPWSTAQTIYRPPESDSPGTLVYAGKSHPELQGGELVITYAANGNEERLAKDMSIYFPRFVRVQFLDRAPAAPLK